MLERTNRQFHAIERLFIEGINHGHVSAMETEKTLIATMDRRLQSVAGDLSKEMDIREYDTGVLKEILDANVPTMAKELKSSHNAEVLYNETSKKLMDGVKKLTEEIEKGKRETKETEEGLVDILRETVRKTREEISMERKAREQEEETVLRLLEDTCSKLKIHSKQ